MRLHDLKLILVWMGKARSFVKYDQNNFFGMFREFSGEIPIK